MNGQHTNIYRYSQNKLNKQIPGSTISETGEIINQDVPFGARNINGQMEEGQPCVREGCATSSNKHIREPAVLLLMAVKANFKQTHTHTHAETIKREHTSFATVQTTCTCRSAAMKFDTTLPTEGRGSQLGAGASLDQRLAESPASQSETVLPKRESSRWNISLIIPIIGVMPTPPATNMLTGCCARSSPTLPYGPSTRTHSCRPAATRTSATRRSCRVKLPSSRTQISSHES